MRRKITGLSRQRMAGITLLELMIVVVIVGVLGMIAIPSYRQYMMRAQRTEAKAALLRLATNQERFYLTNRTYSGDPAVLGFAGGLTERGTYTVTVPVFDATTFTARATPRAGNNPDMTADVCTSFSITAQGVRAAVPDAATCW